MNDASPLPQDGPGEVGLVAWQEFTSREPLLFDEGGRLESFTLRYETYGRLNDARSNAVLICHALSGDHHVAGVHSLRDRKPGWWNALVGPGKPVDTTRWFVICSNCIGGCQGSTGPGSIDPRTGKPFGVTFPVLTIGDMVAAQLRLLDHLGIERLHAVIGGSMGGMQVLEWGVRAPERSGRLLALATTARSSAQAIAFNAVGRQAIMEDKDWRGGAYSAGEGPRVGLAIARMMAHITYLSDASLDRKFGRKETGDTSGGSLGTFFEVERYLNYQGQSFINRFDANTYLYFTRALDRFDLIAAHGSLEDAFARVQDPALVVGFTSDWLYPPRENRAIALALVRRKKRASYVELATDLGHDSFLLESPALYRLIQGFLEADGVRE